MSEAKRYRWIASMDTTDDEDPMYSAMTADSEEVLNALWREANHQIGKRAPADDLPILVYGYVQGRLDQMRKTSDYEAAADALELLVADIQAHRGYLEQSGWNLVEAYGLARQALRRLRRLREGEAGRV